MTHLPSSDRHSSLLLRFAPGLFVILWSTGFIGAKYGLPYCGPLTFLFLRFCIVSLVLGLVALGSGAVWPKGWRASLHCMVAGLLVHGFYLGGVFTSIHLGMPAGLSSLIVGLQPVLTALLAGFLLGERLLPRQWAGLGLGLIGVGLVVGEKAFGPAAAQSSFGLAAVLCALMALVGITLGTLYQKRFGAAQDLRAATVLQYLACTVVYLPLAASEGFHVDLTLPFAAAMAWLVLVLSVGAIGLLMMMIRRGEASKVASFFYLVPPVTAFQGWLLFQESLGLLAITGMAAAAFGVALTVKR